MKDGRTMVVSGSGLRLCGTNLMGSKFRHFIQDFQQTFISIHHNVVVREKSYCFYVHVLKKWPSKLGGSHATTPCLAERRTLRNWYQRNYPYTSIGAQVVYVRQNRTLDWEAGQSKSKGGERIPICIYTE
jgi:hypothetical protein